METRNEGTITHSHNQLRCWISKVQAMARTSTVNRRKKNMQILRILLLNIMKSHMERVFSR